MDAALCLLQQHAMSEYAPLTRFLLQSCVVPTPNSLAAQVKAEDWPDNSVQVLQYDAADKYPSWAHAWAQVIFSYLQSWGQFWFVSFLPQIPLPQAAHFFGKEYEQLPLVHEFSAVRPEQHGLLAETSSPSAAQDAVVVLQSAGQLVAVSPKRQMR